MPQNIGLIGAGAFGAFIVPHLAAFCPVLVHDPLKDISAFAAQGLTASTLEQTAACEIVILAVPVQQMEKVLTEIAPLLKPGALVMDVASVKMKIAGLMTKILPPHVDAVGLHPLFGPQSGKDGIANLNIVVCNVRGSRGPEVVAFLKDKLILNVFETTPEDHDRQLAYVQGLTHLLGKVFVSMNLPKFALTTKTYDLIDQAVEFIRYDSDELFKAIERENPYTAEAKEAFFNAARKLEEKLSRD